MIATDFSTFMCGTNNFAEDLFLSVLTPTNTCCYNMTINWMITGICATRSSVPNIASIPLFILILITTTVIVITKIFVRDCVSPFVNGLLWSAPAFSQRYS
ncbi:hypothetical protein Anas_08693 [Armadillidium nasatum]|uniref:Uncharacterized protein n=1 Tax=Armadillidium nasatum TaxID=96803 RepID=A0A5N5SKR2_9CRUS|nr:hypothetical protein Anas_08693 [Armadillidium nasatum]